MKKKTIIWVGLAVLGLFLITKKASASKILGKNQVKGSPMEGRMKNDFGSLKKGDKVVILGEGKGSYGESTYTVKGETLPIPKSLIEVAVFSNYVDSTPYDQFSVDSRDPMVFS
jgi:hypothetical protein